MLQTRKATYIWALRSLNSWLLFAAVSIAPLFAQEEGHQEHSTPAKLVQEVRESTRQFLT